MNGWQGLKQKLKVPLPMPSLSQNKAQPPVQLPAPAGDSAPETYQDESTEQDQEPKEFPWKTVMTIAGLVLVLSSVGFLFWSSRRKL